jgi:hypothetical protein
MTRRFLALLPLLVLLLAGCATAPATADNAVEIPGVGLQDEEPAAPLAAEEPEEREQRSGRPGVGFGDYAMTVPKNLVWWPWKILGGGGRGFVDGAGAGFDDNRMPILGLVLLPVNAAIGLVTGLGVGVVSEPGVIGPRTPFSRTMGIPTKRPTPIWWLPQ